MIINLHLHNWEFREGLTCEAFTFECSTNSLIIYPSISNLTLPREIYNNEDMNFTKIFLEREDFFCGEIF